MILVFDVGNTETTIGLFNGEVLRGHWRIITGVARTADEFGVLIRSLLQSADFESTEVDGVAIGSVGAAVTAPLADACARSLPVGSSIVVDARAGLPITLRVDEPLTVGADRIINTLAASRLYSRDCIVVDLGTATTFDCITAEGVFIGGGIAPRVPTPPDTPIRRAAKPPAAAALLPRSGGGK